MRIGSLKIACTVFLVSGCGLADQYATWVPKVLRQPSAELPEAESEPDVKKLVGDGNETLFTSHPIAVSVSRARRNDVGKGFTVCVRALVPGPINPEPQTVTLVVAIERGALSDRRRVTPEDRCEIEKYERVELKIAH
jgi:hypothetical protein